MCVSHSNLCQQPLSIFKMIKLSNISIYSLFHNSFPIFLISLFILSFILYSYPYLDFPWNIIHDGNCGSANSIHALNYVKLGYLQTLFGPLENNISNLQSGAQNYVYYTHHPMILPIIISIPYHIFGFSEWAARLVPLFLHLGSIVILFLICKENFSQITGLISCFFYVFSPVTFHISLFVSFEPLIIFTCLLSTYFYFKWIKSKEKLFFNYLIISLFLTLNSDWVGYFIMLSILTHYLLYEKKPFDEKNIKYLAVLVIISLISFLSFLCYIWLLTGSPLGGTAQGDLYTAFLKRVNLGETKRTYSSEQIIQRTTDRLGSFFETLIVFSLLFYPFLLIIKYKKNREICQKSEPEYLSYLFPGIALLFLSSYLFIFLSYYMIHDITLSVINPWVFLIGGISWEFILTKLFSLLKSVSSKNQILAKLVKPKFLMTVMVILLIYLHFQDIYPRFIVFESWRHDVFPLSKFLNENPGNILVTFGIRPGVQILTFYFESRNVKNVTYLSDFKEIMGNNPNSYQLIITDQNSNKDLINYLDKLYNKTYLYSRYGGGTPQPLVAVYFLNYSMVNSSAENDSDTFLDVPFNQPSFNNMVKFTNLKISAIPLYGGDYYIRVNYLLDKNSRKSLANTDFKIIGFTYANGKIFPGERKEGNLMDRDTLNLFLPNPVPKVNYSICIIAIDAKTDRWYSPDNGIKCYTQSRKIAELYLSDEGHYNLLPLSDPGLIVYTPDYITTSNESCITKESKLLFSPVFKDKIRFSNLSMSIEGSFSGNLTILLNYTTNFLVNSDKEITNSTAIFFIHGPKGYSDQVQDFYLHEGSRTSKLILQSIEKNTEYDLNLVVVNSSGRWIQRSSGPPGFSISQKIATLKVNEKSVQLQPVIYFPFYA